jgi:hypothetical protein
MYLFLIQRNQLLWNSQQFNRFLYQHFLWDIDMPFVGHLVQGKDNPCLDVRKSRLRLCQSEARVPDVFRQAPDDTQG